MEKFGGENVWRIYSFKCLAEKIWQMNKSAKGLLIVATTLDGFSLVDRLRFAKLSTCQTFLLYSMYYINTSTGMYIYT